jgi:DNA polymerase-3 subunit epsilon
MFDPDMIEKMEESGDFRILRRLDLSLLPHQRDVEADLSISAGLALDVETTGLDPERHSIIELACRIFWFDASGKIVALGDPQSWTEDPGEPLSPAVRRLTGLRDIDLLAWSIDEEALKRQFYPVDFVVAHHAAFDRRFFEKRFPAIKNLAWACSCREIDWPAHGFDGRGLSSLLMQAGFFSGARAHRAGADVDAVIGLLRHELPSGRTALAEMIEAAKRVTWRFSAQGASFDCKFALKDRGYFWSQFAFCWWIEVEDAARAAEEAWLMANVYAPRFHPSMAGPKVERVTWCERHAR